MNSYPLIFHAARADRAPYGPCAGFIVLGIPVWGWQSFDLLDALSLNL
ncbi:hypothetical protein LMG22931_05045 [Paraburkholderia nemoris]|nr:hypothetical protein LMG22931_05045 [Paraburkholderia nemoris]